MLTACGYKVAHLRCTLPVDLQQQITAFTEYRFDPILRCAITRAMYFRTFQKLTVLQHLQETCFRQQSDNPRPPPHPAAAIAWCTKRSA